MARRGCARGRMKKQYFASGAPSSFAKRRLTPRPPPSRRWLRRVGRRERDGVEDLAEVTGATLCEHLDDLTGECLGSLDRFSVETLKGTKAAANPHL
ncbi:MAG: hypothetical protein CM15mP18_4130 [Methanobacteriota archaeon]|nr:MAG: hypothetical protein CM15mP18_4130 [Euryarchaeota archaeon]